MRHTTRKPATRWRTMGLLLCSLALTSVGCSHTEQGLTAGGIGGGLVGGLVGRSMGNTAAGAVIGAATGAIAGGAIGNGADRAEARAEARAIQAEHRAVQAARGPLGLEEVARLARSQVGDEVIVEQIRLTNAVYTLNAEQLIWLKEQGVSDRVIRAMQTSGTQVPPLPPVRYVVAPPPATVIYQPRPVYVAPCLPPPPPVVGVGVGVQFRR